MPKLNAAQELAAAIRNVAKGSDPKTGSAKIAEEFYRENPAIFKPFIDTWVIEKLASLIGKHRAKERRAADPQLAFEDMFGFKHLPNRLEVQPGGETVPRSQATIGAWRNIVRKLRKTESPALEHARRAVALMAKYTPQHPRITWNEVLEREANKEKRR